MTTTLATTRPRALTARQFHELADVPPEVEWFANIDNARTRRAYRIDLQDFMIFTGIARPEEFRLVTRSHVIGWRKELEARELAPTTIRRKLSALSSLFDYLCERNAITHNPSRASSGPLPITMRARHRPWVTTRLERSWMRHRRTRLKASGTGRSWPLFFITASVRPSWFLSRYGISSIGKACPICASRERAAKSASCR